MDTIRVAQVGLGALGRMLTHYLVERPNLKLVGAVDTDPAVAGWELSEVAGLPNELGVTVVGSIPALPAGEIDVAVLTTGSHLESVKPQLEALCARGVNVVSSCEELSYPWTLAPEVSADLDRRAKEAGVSLLGTGVNPGYLMDLFPIVLTGICREVKKITVLRYQDATHRRLPFQMKIGAGLTPAEFDEERRSGRLRHVGLAESMHMIAARLGWKLERVTDTINPILAERTLDTPELSVDAGEAAGVFQLGQGWVEGEERIRLEFRAAIGEPAVQDTVIIEGIPSLRVSIPEGVHGDIATCSILTNAIPVVYAAAPGLHTMIDVPPVGWYAG